MSILGRHFLFLSFDRSGFFFIFWWGGEDDNSYDCRLEKRYVISVRTATDVQRARTVDPRLLHPQDIKAKSSSLKEEKKKTHRASLHFVV